MLFSGTRFTIGTVEITTMTDIFMDKVYPSEIVAKLIENVGGELIKDNWTISLVNKRGSNTGVEFRYGKNQASLKRETDAKGVITRLYPFGKDGLQIAGSLGYIDSPLIDNYDRPRAGHIDYKDIEDPAELLTAAQAEWSTSEKDGIDKPIVTYSGEFIELKKLQEYGDVEAFGLGDIVKIIDEGLDADTTQRIMEYDYYPYEPKKSTVSLSNTKPAVYKNNRPSNIIGDMIGSGNYVRDMQTSSGDINSGWLDNIRAKLQTEINGMVQTALQHVQADIYLNNQTNPTKALILGPGLFAIANSKKPNGDWDWRTIATGDKLIADEVDALWVYAGRVKANQLIIGGENGYISFDDLSDKPVIPVLPYYIKSTYIDATTIQSPTIMGGRVIGGTLETADDTAKRIVVDTAGITSYNANKKDGFYAAPGNYGSSFGIKDNGYSVMTFGWNGVGDASLEVPGNFHIYVYGSGSRIALHGDVDLSDADVSGLDNYVKSHTGQDLSLLATETGIAVRVDGVTLGSIFYD